MKRIEIKIVVIISVLAMGAACAPPPTKLEPSTSPAAPAGSASPGRAGGAPAMPPAGMTASAQGELVYKAPAGWTQETPSSRMRVAQFQLPKAAGDAEDASLVIFYFGPGQGGSPQANLDRWTDQMQQPDGSSSRDKAKTRTMTVNGMAVSLLDVTGTYTAEMNPGAGDRQNKPQSRMLAAVIETPKGAYFAKLVGPEKTVTRWEPEFMAFLNSMQFKA